MHEFAIKFGLVLLLASPATAFSVDGVGNAVIFTAAVVTAAGILYRKVITPILVGMRHIERIPAMEARQIATSARLDSIVRVEQRLDDAMVKIDRLEQQFGGAQP